MVNQNENIQEQNLAEDDSASHFLQPFRVKSFIQGWQRGAVGAIFAAAFVLILNITWTAWAMYHSHGQNQDGIFTIYEGSCARVKNLSLWLHFGINITCTILLSACTYVQQSLVAPTRSEVNMAHKSKAWLNISLPSVGNLRVVDEFSSFERLENSACIDYYYTQFESQRGDVIAILDDNTPQGMLDLTIIGRSVPATSGRGVAWGWMCLATPDLEEPPVLNCPRPSPDNWQLQPTYYGTYAYQNTNVSYCLSKPAVEHCKLQFSLVLMIIVMISNVLKIVCMIGALFASKAPPLVTIGDAIASFLTVPDDATKGRCMVSKSEFSWSPGKKKERRPWTPVRHWWFISISKAFWVISLLFYVVSLGAAAYFLAKGVVITSDFVQLTGRISVNEMWETGIGNVDINSLLLIAGNEYSDLSQQLATMVLLANLPQLIISFLYIIYNASFATILVEKEWNMIGIKQRGLRVTHRRGA
ncbi:hypothetical protein G7Y89_g4941 [Cudoniella acicularis]|uniref:DUF6536 domain-containing protein n=1 Tax=Cudoniella acicularis TaxID=354080 RepID=A0A8H4W6Y6_9HELO|nr:hypothetical protein G7Y89_g4941 [Cudoniella acicularis]